jgi:hypothetical protein
MEEEGKREGRGKEGEGRKREEEGKKREAYALQTEDMNQIQSIKYVKIGDTQTALNALLNEVNEMKLVSEALSPEGSQDAFTIRYASPSPPSSLLRPLLPSLFSLLLPLPPP